ncbi:MAG: VOC family protein [Alteromonadaceae bacterium]|nr:VOC family protein [Alteromonadaceae bacterium]
MKFLHSMVRIQNLEESLDFYINKLGLIETRRSDVPAGKFTLIFLATEVGAAEIELTYNWDNEEQYGSGRNFGHLAFEVDDIYQICQKLQAAGIVINRPPRCGHMAFVKSPDGISIELLQKGGSLPPQEPWLSMENTGSW